MKEDYLQLFNLFVGKDELRPELLQPCKQNGKYFATDAHAMVYMDSNIIELDFKEQEKPNFHKVIPVLNKRDVEFDVKSISNPHGVILIQETLSDIVTCEQCNGAGYLICNMDHQHDCKECDGHGIYEINKRPSGRFVLPGDLKYSLGDSTFSAIQLNRLVKACEILKVDKIKKIGGTGIKGNLFKVSDTVFIVIMPFFTSDSDKIIKIKQND